MIVIGTLSIGGGAEKVAAALATGLTARGYDAHIVTFYEGTENYPHTGTLFSFGERLDGRVGWRKALRIPIRMLLLRKYIQDHKIDSVVSFLEEANFYTILTKILFFLKQPVIVSVRININRRSWIFRITTRILYPFAKKVVCVSRGVERILQQEYQLRNTITIYNPLDVPFAQKMSKESLPAEFSWLSKRSPLFISNGRYTHQKGQWHLIRAFAAIVQEYPEATLGILGGGEYEQKLLDLITKSRLEKNVFLLGRHPNIYPFLHQADAFVFSSLFEGMPNAMLEALALGLPIISAECLTGPREIIAPQLDVEESITYPFISDLGILTAPLSSDEIWEPLESVALTDGEQGLVHAMRLLLARDKKSTVSTSHYVSYDPNRVIDEWADQLNV